MHMPKIRTTITISPDLLEKARKHDISISSFLDIELRKYIALIEFNGPTGIRTPVSGSEGRKDIHYLMGPLLTYN